MEDCSLVVRKPCFGLATACPSCLPVYLYLKFANLPFKLDYNLTSPDSDKIPYVECGEYVAYNNENGGVIETLKEDRIVDLDTEFEVDPEWTSMKEMVCSWLADAIKYELWLGTDATSAQTIYCSDLPWPIGKVLFRRQVSDAKQQLGIAKDNAEEIKEQIYNRASIAFGVMSTKLAYQMFLYGHRPSSLDAVFLSQALITLKALPETSVLRSMLSKHENLVEYASRTELFAAGTSSSVLNFYANPASSALSKGPSNWGSSWKTKPNKEKAKEERDFKTKRVFISQLVSALGLVIASTVVLGPKVELEDDKGFFDLRIVKLT